MDLFWTVAAILVILWLLGLISGVGGLLIHALLVIAVIVIEIRLVQGRNAVTVERVVAAQLVAAGERLELPGSEFGRDAIEHARALSLIRGARMLVVCYRSL